MNLKFKREPAELTGTLRSSERNNKDLAFVNCKVRPSESIENLFVNIIMSPADVK